MKMPVYTPVWNWRNKKNKSERYPVHIRIHLAGDDKYEPVQVPQKVGKNEWTDKAGSWVKNTHPFAFEINNAIKAKLDILDALVKRYYEAKKSLNYPLIFRELQKNNNTNSFNTYFKDYITDPRETVDEETLKRYAACLQHLNRFNKAITFNDLSSELFLDFKKYLEDTATLVGSTINGYFNAIKKVVYWSRKDHHITKEHQESIFEDVHIKVGKAKKDHLELDEVKEWIDYQFTEQFRVYERDRDMFQLLIYTGYYYNDLRELLKSEYKKDPEYGPYLKSDRYKNDNLAIIPLWKFPKAVDLIEKYRDSDTKSPYLLRRDAFIEDQPFNRNLKVIAGEKMLGWKRNVYNKLGRTTNSQLWIRFGAKRSIVSKMMGHEKEETTSAYFEVNVRDVIEGTKDIDFTSLGL